MMRDRGVRVEGSLLPFALGILLFGLLLTFFAKSRMSAPADMVNLNTASPPVLAATFQLDPVLAGVLVEQRERLGGFVQTHQLASLSVFPPGNTLDRVRASLEQSHLDVNAADGPQLERILAIPGSIARRIVAYRALRPLGRFAKPADLLSVPVVDDDAITALGDRLVVREPVGVFGRFLVTLGLLLAVYLAIPVLLRRRGVKGDPFLVPVTLVLLAFGLTAQLSIKDPLRDTPVFEHQAVGVVGGLAMLAIGALLPVARRRALRHYTYVWALAAIGLLGALWLFGHGPEGVRLSLGGFQPVEIIKILLILFLASYLTTRSDLLAETINRWQPPLPKNLSERFRGIALPRRVDVMPLLGMFAVALLMFFIVKDMGPALLLFGAFLGLVYMGTGRSSVVWAGMLLIGLAATVAVAAHVGVVPVRVGMWRSPWDNPFRNGMQLGQALWAMASGGWCGTGLGLGAVSSSAITRAGSDLVFATLGEELGFFGLFTILALFCVLVCRGIRVAIDAQNEFDRLLAAGLSALLASQAFLITAGVTGLLPLSGITLPFVSYGTSSLVASCFMVGLLRGISAPTQSVPIGTLNPRFTRCAVKAQWAVCFLLLGAVGVGRLLWVQVFAADRVAARTISTPDADRVVRAKINPRLLAIARTIPRGTIYDRRGRVLATSRLDEMTANGLSAAEAAKRVAAGERYYPHGPAFAQLVGYADPALGGPVGIERDFNRDLRGFTSYSDLVSVYRGKDMPAWLGGGRPGAGHDVYLTVDASLQEDALVALKAAAGSVRDRRSGRRKDRAAMVMMDPATGEVIVAASIPSFDPNRLTPAGFQKLVADQGQENRLFDRARNGSYPPGSSIKVAIAAAGLEAGLDPAYRCAHSSGMLTWGFDGKRYARKTLRDDQGDPPHGSLHMAQALTVSCNLYFANLAMNLGVDPLHTALADADRFALRQTPAAPSLAASLPDVGFGQGTMRVSPLDMARVAESVANRGFMMQPTYYREVREHGGKTALRKPVPVVMSRPMGELNAGRLADMMRSVVTRGTARGVFDALRVEVAGKTGTAQTDQGDRMAHSWFIGYAPFTRPQYAFACVIENGGYGKEGAAPAIRDVLMEVFGR